MLHFVGNISEDFRMTTQLLKLTKIRPLRAELFHADGRTDMTKLILAFRNFAKEPKNQ